MLAAGAGIAYADFSVTTSPPQSSFSAAASFCVSPGTQAATDDADAWVNQGNVNQNNGSTSPLNVQPNSGQNRRALIHFSLPALPHNCTVTSATLTVTVNSGTTGRTLNVFQAAATWVETTVTWANQPATTGSSSSAASASSGNISWTVTSQVQAMYSGTNTGFIIKDSAEASGSGNQKYNSREAASNKPQLSITFG